MRKFHKTLIGACTVAGLLAAGGAALAAGAGQNLLSGNSYGYSDPDISPVDPYSYGYSEPDITPVDPDGYAYSDPDITPVDDDYSDPIITPTNSDGYEYYDPDITPTDPDEEGPPIVTPTAGPADSDPDPAGPASVEGTITVVQGGTLSLNLTGFVPNEQVEIGVHLESGYLKLTVLRVDATGSTRGTVTIPQNLPLGPHTIDAIGLTSGRVATLAINVVAKPAENAAKVGKAGVAFSPTGLAAK
jgi:hypothetical protein